MNLYNSSNGKVWTVPELDDYMRNLSELSDFWGTEVSGEGVRQTLIPKVRANINFNNNNWDDLWKGVTDERNMKISMIGPNNTITTLKVPKKVKTM